MDMQRTALVLGATGGIGGEIAHRLAAQGWRVKALHRERTGFGDGIEWLTGDAMRADDVGRAASDAALIVHAVNPPGYRGWGELVMPMLESTIAAARSSGARILLPGTIYNYGPDAFPLLRETSPQNPITVKGAIRVEMERRLKAAAEDGVRSLIVRAGDYFGPKARNNWFSQALIRPGQPVRAIGAPGRSGVGHQWAYLPDVAETMLQLVAREAALPAFETFHMGGHWDADGRGMTAAIRRALGRPDLREKPLPWGQMALASPFVPLFRELREMRYLWQTPIRLDNAKLIATLGSEPHTPLDDAVKATLAGLGVLAPEAAGGARAAA